MEGLIMLVGSVMIFISGVVYFMNDSYWKKSEMPQHCFISIVYLWEIVFDGDDLGVIVHARNPADAILKARQALKSYDVAGFYNDSVINVKPYTPEK